MCGPLENEQQLDLGFGSGPVGLGADADLNYAAQKSAHRRRLVVFAHYLFAHARHRLGESVGEAVRASLLARAWPIRRASAVSVPTARRLCEAAAITAF